MSPGRLLLFCLLAWSLSPALADAASIPPCRSETGCLLAEFPGKSIPVDEDYDQLSLSEDGFFGVYWNEEGDSAAAPGHVERILAALVLARQTFLALPGAWEIPLGDREHYPVYLAPLGAPGGTSPPWESGGWAGLTHIVLDNEMSPWGGDQAELAEVTAAHELFHAFQFARVFDWRDLAFYEATAVWAEDLVFPAHDDWVDRYALYYMQDPGAPLDAHDGGREYGAAAAVKFLLGGSATPATLLECLEGQDPALERAWPRLLALLEEPPAEALNALLAELLHAGCRAGWGGGAWPIEELDLLPAVDLSGLPALWAPVEGAEVPLPADFSQLPGLSMRIARIAAGGEYGVDHAFGAAAASAAALLHWPDWQPSAAVSGGTTELDPGDFLLLANSGAEAVNGGLEMLWIGAGVFAGGVFRIYPDPGGPWRGIHFQTVPGRLILYDLLGRRVWSWTPEPRTGLQRLLLPQKLRGPFILEEERSGFCRRILILW